MKPPHDALLLAGRVLVALGPLVAGVHHARNLPGTAAFLKDAARMPGAGVPLAASFAAFETAAALALLAGWRTRLLAPALAAYTAVLTGFAHLRPALEAVDPLVRDAEYYHALRGLAACGALLVLAAAGPGRHALDAR